MYNKLPCFIFNAQQSPHIGQVHALFSLIIWAQHLRIQHFVYVLVIIVKCSRLLHFIGPLRSLWSVVRAICWFFKPIFFFNDSVVVVDSVVSVRWFASYFQMLPLLGISSQNFVSSLYCSLIIYYFYDFLWEGVIRWFRFCDFLFQEDFVSHFDVVLPDLFFVIFGCILTLLSGLGNIFSVGWVWQLWKLITVLSLK